MNTSSILIAVFVSTHETLRAERAFKEKRIKVRATVKPRSISSNCQLAIEFAEEDKEAAAAIIKEDQLDFIGFFRRSEEGEWALHS